MVTIWTPKTNVIESVGPYYFDLQSNHNLVLKDSAGLVMWSTNTLGVGEVIGQYGTAIKNHINLNKNACCVDLYGVGAFMGNGEPLPIYEVAFSYCVTRWGTFTCPTSVAAGVLLSENTIRGP